MESTNLHHLHQDHEYPHHSSPSSTPSLFPHSWTPDNVAPLNAGNLSPNFQEANPRTRAFTHKKDIGGAHHHHFVNASGLGYHHQWASGEESCVRSTQSDQYDLDLHYSKIKEERPDVFPCKFTDMLNSNTGSSNMENKDFNALSDKLLLKSLSSGDFYSTSTSHNFANNFGGGGGGLGMGVTPSRRTSFSQIYPSINISNLNNHSSNSPAISSSLDMNMQSSDLLNSARFNGSLSLHAQDGLAGFDNVSFRLDHHMHQHHQIERSSCDLSNPSHFTNGMGETKRSSTSLVESKASCQSQNVTKKSRLESRSSCPPFKVRKEKLGDRIAALQQLVAPFGKTDTASVLMEAIGYIKFLQNQVETLSVPYMKSSRNQNNRAMVPGLSGTREEPKMDLRSRGLCLVPLSCMSYLADGAVAGAGSGSGGGVWQQPDFGGPSL
ncbi:hypothetical protein K1719_010671 [Acacia pycnantha]|nr:hypothetical protein K1719_010671 [Acacia pycnantha]